MNQDLYSIEAEHAVLGSLLVNPDAVDRIGSLGAADFYHESHRLIFSAIIALAAASKAVDVVTVHNALAARGESDRTGGLAYLGEIANGGFFAGNAAHYADTIRDRAIQRRIRAAAAQVHDEVARHDRTTAQKLDFAQAAFSGLADSATIERAAPQGMQDALPRHLARIEQRAEGLENGVSTGFQDLDRRLSGGMRAGQLILIAARPAMGKTALALQIVANCAHSGTTSLFCSQEMQEADLMDRLLAIGGRVPLERLLTGQLTNDDWGRVTVVTKTLHQAPLYLDEQPALTLQAVRNKARQVRRKAGSLGLLVVDYLQLMTGDGANRNSEIEEISRGLKRLAKEMQMPVIALSQLNRAVEQRPNRRPMLSDLRDSGAIEQDADVVISVYRDEAYNPDSPHRGCAEIGMLKVRQGKSGGFVPLTFSGEFTRFDSFSGSWAAPPERLEKHRRSLIGDD